MADDDSNFLSRWSRRKAVARQGPGPVAEAARTPAPPEPPVPAAPVMPATAAPAPPATLTPDAAAPTPGPAPALPPPTLADVAALTRESDYARFVTPDVAPDVRNAALKQLFTDPHYNVMDGLDTYIGDYNTPDPLPAGMLRQMVQSQLLGLFDDEEKPVAAPPDPPGPGTPEPTLANTAPAPAATHEDTDLQLQPDDDAGCPGADAGPVADARRPD
jgi:hypothetical protein